MSDQLKNKILDLGQWVQNPDMQVLKCDKKITRRVKGFAAEHQFLPISDCDVLETIEDYHYILYLDKQLCSFRWRFTMQCNPLLMQTVFGATVYNPPFGVYRYDDRSIKGLVRIHPKLENIYKVQAPQRVGDNAIDGDAILCAYKIASRYSVCNSGTGARDYVARGSSEGVWVDSKDSSGIEYDGKKHLFTPAEYDIVSQMLHRKFMSDERVR